MEEKKHNPLYEESYNLLKALDYIKDKGDLEITPRGASAIEKIKKEKLTNKKELAFKILSGIGILISLVIGSLHFFIKTWNICNFQRNGIYSWYEL